MKKEIKYTLLSFPAIYLSLLLTIIAIQTIIPTPHLSASFIEKLGDVIMGNTGDWISGNIFRVGFFYSLFLSPIYIIIPLITYFTVRHIRIKKEAGGLVPSPVNTSQPKKKILLISIVLVVIFFILQIWMGMMGANTVSIIQSIKDIFKPSSEIQTLDPMMQEFRS